MVETQFVFHRKIFREFVSDWSYQSSLEFFIEQTNFIDGFIKFAFFIEFWVWCLGQSSSFFEFLDPLKNSHGEFIRPSCLHAIFVNIFILFVQILDGLREREQFRQLSFKVFVVFDWIEFRAVASAELQGFRGIDICDAVADIHRYLFLPEEFDLMLQVFSWEVFAVEIAFDEES